MDVRRLAGGRIVFTIAALIFPALGELPAGEPAPSAGGAGFRRVVFEQTVPLQGEAPGVAAQGHWAAFIAPPTLHLVDLRTGAVAIKHDLEGLGGGEDAQGTVLGFAGDRLIVLVFRDPERPKPDSGVARFNYGPARGQYQVVAVRLPGAEVKLGAEAVQAETLCDLPAGAAVAPGLLDGRLVYTQDNDLHIRPLDGGAEQVFPLKEKPWYRPRIKDGGVLGRTARWVYVLRPGAGGLSQASCVGTALAPLLSVEAELDWCGDLLLVGCGDGLIAADLNGQERWRIALPYLKASGGDGQVICAKRGPLLLGLSPRDGRVLWRAYRDSRYQKCWPQVVDGRLVVFGEDMLSLHDIRSGACLMNMAQDRKFVRRVHYGGDIHLKAAVAGKVLVVGYETWVSGVDLTPTAEVPKDEQSRDPANASGKAAEWLQARPSMPVRGGREYALAMDQQRSLTKFARDLADTPAVVPSFEETVRALLESPGRGGEDELNALGWYPSALIPKAALRSLRGSRKPNYPMDLIAIMAAHPEAETRRALLEQLATNQADFTVELRDCAARYLRLEDQAPWLDAEGRRLLYGTDQAAAVAEFSKRLSDADPGKRAAALALLRQAPDAVLVALADKLKNLPEAAERESGAEMVGQARARLNLIAKTPAVFSP